MSNQQETWVIFNAGGWDCGIAASAEDEAWRRYHDDKNMGDAPDHKWYELTEDARICWVHNLKARGWRCEKMVPAAAVVSDTEIELMRAELEAADDVITYFENNRPMSDEQYLEFEDLLDIWEGYNLKRDDGFYKKNDSGADPA